MPCFPRWVDDRGSGGLVQAPSPLIVCPGRSSQLPFTRPIFLYKNIQVSRQIYYPPHSSHRLDLLVLRGQRLWLGMLAPMSSLGPERLAHHLQNTSCSEVLGTLYQGQLFSRSFWSFVQTLLPTYRQALVRTEPPLHTGWLNTGEAESL